MPRKKKHCYYALRDHHYGGAPHVVMVYEGEDGYRLVNPHSDLGGPCKDMEQAERCAAYWNKVIGVSKKKADEMVTKSMGLAPCPAK